MVSGPVYPSAEELDRAKAYIFEAFGVTESEIDAIDNGYEAALKAAQAEFEFFRDVVIPHRMEQFFKVEIRLGEVPCPDGCTFGGPHWHERRCSGYTTLQGYVPRIEEVIHGVQ